jgi:hypothetical protein
LPITTRWRWSARENRLPAAMPTFSAVSAVIGQELAIPRIPSVPKYLRVIAFRRFLTPPIHQLTLCSECGRSAIKKPVGPTTQGLILRRARMRPSRRMLGCRAPPMLAKRLWALLHGPYRRLPYGERLAGLGDVVDPHHLHPLHDDRHRRAERAGDPPPGHRFRRSACR